MSVCVCVRVLVCVSDCLSCDCILLPFGTVMFVRASTTSKNTQTRVSISPPRQEKRGTVSRREFPACAHIKVPLKRVTPPLLHDLVKATKNILEKISEVALAKLPHHTTLSSHLAQIRGKDVP